VNGYGNVITMNKPKFIFFKTKKYLLFKNPFLIGAEVKVVQQSIYLHMHMGKLNLQKYDV
jgi:hypothetical protein